MSTHVYKVELMHKSLQGRDGAQLPLHKTYLSTDKLLKKLTKMNVASRFSMSFCFILIPSKGQQITLRNNINALKIGWGKKSI